MKPILLTLALFFGMAGCLSAQATLFHYTYAADTADILEGMVATGDSGYILVGHSEQDPAHQKPLIVKMNTLGQVEWSSMINTVHSGRFDHIEPVSDGNYIISGAERMNDTSVGFSYYIMKINPNGSILWQQQWALPVGFNLEDGAGYLSVRAKENTDHGFAVMGYVLNNASNYSYFHIFKINAAGQLQWSQLCDSSFKSDEGDLQIRATGNRGSIFVSGTMDDIRPIVIGMDNNGNHIWSQAYPDTAFNDYLLLTGFCFTPDAGMLFSGNYYNWTNNSSGFALFRTDSLGQIVWARKYLTPFSSGGPVGALLPTPDSAFVFSCFLDGHDGTSLIRAEWNSHLTWSKIYNAPTGYVFPVCTAQAADSGFALGGNWNDNAGHLSRFSVIKTSTTGVTSCGDSDLALEEKPLTLVPGDTFSTRLLFLSEQVVHYGFYHVEVTGQDACFSLAVPSATPLANFSMEPNPCAGAFTITGIQHAGMIRLYDITGTLRMNLQTDRSGRATFDVSALPAGVYLVEAGGLYRKLVKIN